MDLDQRSFFKGLKIVEFASVLAGPAVGMFFAELGAQVLKIENKATGGDVTRGWKNPLESAETKISAYWSSVNWGKETWMLDLSQADELQRALEAVSTADIVISNFKPSAAKRFGLSAEVLRARYPRLIYAQLNAYADPGDERPAFDAVLQAEAGFMFMNGEALGPPVKMPVALIDVLAAHQLKEGILLALLRRQSSGQGATVTTSLIASALASLVNQAGNYLMTGYIPKRMGTQHPNIAPYGDVYTTSDHQSILLAVGTERQFVQLCHSLALSSLLDDERFRQNTARVQHRTTLNLLLQEKIGQWALEPLMQLFNEAAVPAARIRDMAQVFELPAAQQMVLEAVSEGAPMRCIQSVAFKMTD